MALIRCAGCKIEHNFLNNYDRGFDGSPCDEDVIKSTLICSSCGRATPFEMGGKVITALPAKPGDTLRPEVPIGLAQDVEEAQSDYFSQSFKSAVIMCRRALQLGLQEEPYNIPDGGLSGMLKSAQSLPKPVFSPRTYAFAEAIKDCGDAGAHMREDITADDARMVISATI